MKESVTDDEIEMPVLAGVLLCILLCDDFLNIGAKETGYNFLGQTQIDVNDCDYFVTNMSVWPPQVGSRLLSLNDHTHHTG